MKNGVKVLIALGAVSVVGAGCDNRSTDATVRSETVLALTEPESAAVLSRVNAGEIETSQVFRPLGAHDEVIGFADRLIDEHARVEGLLLATGIAQEPNTVAMELDADAAQQIALMTRAGAVAAEPIYLNSQAAMHRQVLLLIDCAILPGTTTDGFRRFVLEQVRPKVREHYELASQLAGQFSDGNGGGVAGVITVDTLANGCEQACDAQVVGGFSVGVRDAACR